MKAHQDILAFQADATELKHSVLPLWARYGISIVAIMLLVFLLWACIGKVDVIVTTQGKIVSLSPTIVMKPLERTVIKTINVAVGERVKKGQVLITFDPVFSEADEERLANDLGIFSAQYERLLAEFNNESYAPKTPLTFEKKWQYEIFQQRKSLYSEKLVYFSKETERLDEELISLQETLKNQRKRLIVFGDLENMLSRAARAQTGTLRDLKELQLSRMQVELEIANITSEIKSVSIEKLARIAEKNSFVEEWNTKTSEELVKTQQELVRTRNEYEKVVQLKSYVALRAPTDSIVHEISPISVGSAIREAESLITLVPIGEHLEVESEILAKDIGKVKTGATARVKLSAYPFQQYGTLDGKVRYISEDVFSKQKNSDTEATENIASVYRTRITFTAENIKKNKEMSLIPGMEVQAEIRAGERRIISYLLNPLIKSLDEAIREP